MASFSLPEGFLLGVATSGAQIEGGDKNNSWFDWAQRGHIKDGANLCDCVDHWDRYEEDITLMADMGIKVYRLGVEWSRVEPEEGVFSQEALAHYKKELICLKENGIKPLITLHHFTNPLWFEKMGGFLCDNAPKLFTEYVEKVIEELGELCSEYITINEPNVYAFMGYGTGSWPPGEKNIKTLPALYANMVRCHIFAYKRIHAIREQMGYSDTLVSFANHLRIFDPADKLNPLHRSLAKAFDTFFQGTLTHAMMTGVCAMPVGDAKMPYGRYYDFIAINYYSRSVLHRLANDTLDNAPKNDLGWEIYPKGILRTVKAMYKKYKAPIWITENGVADSKDAFRSRFIYEHLYALSKADVPVERYYHWTFTDNFEWLEGMSAQFGLVAIEGESKKRIIKDSGYFYSEIIENGGVTEEMYNQYVAKEKYNIW